MLSSIYSAATQFDININTNYKLFKVALNLNFLNLTINKLLVLETFWSYFLTCFC